MNYLFLLFIILLFSCSRNFDNLASKQAETLAILFDMSLSQSFGDINEVLAVWETMPEQVRSTKNPARNPYDFNIEVGNCKKNLGEIEKRIQEDNNGDVPDELVDIIEGFHELYKQSCEAISSPDASYKKVRKFRDNYEPEYKKLQERLTKVQEEYLRKK